MYRIDATNICLQQGSRHWSLHANPDEWMASNVWLNANGLAGQLFDTRKAALRAYEAAAAISPPPPAPPTVTVKLRRRPDGRYEGPDGIMLARTTFDSRSYGRTIQRPGWRITAPNHVWSGYAASLDEARDLISERCLPGPS